MTTKSVIKQNTNTFTSGPRVKGRAASTVAKGKTVGVMSMEKQA